MVFGNNGPLILASAEKGSLTEGRRGQREAPGKVSSCQAKALACKSQKEDELSMGKNKELISMSSVGYGDAILKELESSSIEERIAIRFINESIDSEWSESMNASFVSIPRARTKPSERAEISIFEHQDCSLIQQPPFRTTASSDLIS
jgi:hypothetical protein